MNEFFQLVFPGVTFVLLLILGFLGALLVLYWGIKLVFVVYDVAQLERREALGKCEREIQSEDNV